MPSFAFRRPLLIFRDLLVDRERPDLEKLREESDPERFVWRVLPHAARTFSACIALLPTRAALASAVAYLYCRTLDTCEDLIPDPGERDRALAGFASRLSAGSKTLPPAPVLASSDGRDARDAGHLLLAARYRMVDEVFLRLPADVRALITDLVRDMAEGMRWSIRVFARGGGVLRTDEDLLLYCRHVIGNPVVFTVRLLRWHRTGRTDLPSDLLEDCMCVGEMIQLANVTRDLEKDLRRGIAYVPELREDLGEDCRGDPAVAERLRRARERLLNMALARAPSYRRMVKALSPRRFSLARASALLMLLFTERYYRGCARRAGLEPWRGPSAGLDLLCRAFAGFWSPRFAESEMARIERRFLAMARAAGDGVPRGG